MPEGCKADPKSGPGGPLGLPVPHICNFQYANFLGLYKVRQNKLLYRTANLNASTIKVLTTIEESFTTSSIVSIWDLCVERLSWKDFGNFWSKTLDPTSPWWPLWSCEVNCICMGGLGDEWEERSKWGVFSWSKKAFLRTEYQKGS